MSLQPEVRDAIREATAELGQPDSVGNQIVAWMEGLMTGGEGLDRDDAHRRIEALLSVLQVGESAVGEVE